VVREVQQLVREGVKELNLISQDTTYFGMDRWEEKAGPRQPVDSARGETLCDLIRALDQVKGEFWIRLLYTHPAHWSDELIETIAKSRHVLPYIDMPLQHISEPMLQTMRRETSREHIENLIVRMRAGIPGLVLRTTFIVGFPGETEEDFETLLDFMKRIRFERLGVFEYSQEEGSRAAKMEGQLTTKLKKQRWKKAMALQQKLSREISASQVGKTISVLVESPGVARSISDAPEVDARVYVDPRLQVGMFAPVKITESLEYDLVAEGGAVLSGDPRKNYS
jgi:ribosomal protein S12 methylthiotransferase